MRLKNADAMHYRHVIDNYRRETGEAVVELRDAITWGMEHGHLPSTLDDWVSFHVSRASEAQRMDVTTDEQGRRVRLRHVVELQLMDPQTGKFVQRSLWGNVGEAPDHFLIESIQQRLAKVRADFRAVEADAGYIGATSPHLQRQLTQLLIRFDPRSEGDVAAAE